jgi:hypothetical protein
MKENTDYIGFVDKIFERAENPLGQIQRIFENHPLMFLLKEVCDHINEKIRGLGYQLDMNRIAELNNFYYSCGSRSGSSSGCSSRSRSRDLPCSEKNKYVPCGTPRNRRDRNRGYDRFSNEIEYGLFIALEG